MQMPACPADAPTTVRLARDLWLGANAVRAQDIDVLSREEPLEIRVGTAPIAVLMRTPGHDLDLVTGFALSEGLFKSTQEIRLILPCESIENALGASGDSSTELDSDRETSNVMRIIPQDNVELDTQIFSRGFYATSSCGMCGKRSIEIAMKTATALREGPEFNAETLAFAPTLLRQHQGDFEKTGALHAAGLLNSTGELLVVREDIGRHNAVDKVIGWAARHKQDLNQFALVVSGRISFEIVQKSLFARISCLVGVGGVSSLAVELAEKSGIALAGFARQDRLSIYSGGGRIT